MKTKISGRACWWCLYEELEVKEVLCECGVSFACWHLEVSCRVCMTVLATGNYDYPANIPWRVALEKNLDSLIGGK